MVETVLGDLKGDRHDENGLAVLDGGDPARGETPAVPDAVDFEQDRNGGVAGPLRISKLQEGTTRKATQPRTKYQQDHPYWHGWHEEFDYLLVYTTDRAALSGFAQLRPVADGSFFVIYEIVRDRAAAQ